MKQGNLKKKVSAIFLAAAMTVTSFPAFSVEVHAAELPDTSQFATKEDLKNFDTDDTNGVNPAKVYFGQDGSGSAQAWWIAGSQGDGNLTLFAARALKTNLQFSTISGVLVPISYNPAWDCTYPTGEPAVVSTNHYGASPLREVLKNFETNPSYFSQAEQDLMKDTTIYTDDAKNSSVYFTTNKLYLAYGDQLLNVQYIRVGTNSAGSLYDGLRIDNSYWTDCNSGVFWLREPAGSGGYADYVKKVACFNAPKDQGYVVRGTVDLLHDLAPAFAFDLTSVLFASAAPAASSDGPLTLEDVAGKGAFTMRYSASNLGSVQVSYDYKSVDLTDVPLGTYLVAQNKGGAWAKAVSGTTSVSAGDMGNGFTSFENCRVWLETTKADERKTYASMSAQETKSEYTVNITGNPTLKITSGNAAQRVNAGNAIDEIIVEANSGYYFPDEYITELNKQLDGLNAVKSDGSILKISGKPNNNIDITLPDATKYYVVNVTLGEGMQVRSGSLTQQVDENQSITDVVIEAASGYMFPATYSVAGQNGIAVTRDEDGRVIVSGTPTADTTLTLPAATPKVYGMSLSGEGAFGSKRVGYTPVTATEFTITNTGNMELTNVQVSITGADAGSFTLTWDNNATSIKPNDTITVTVKPNDGLGIKKYQAQLSVSADHCNTVTKSLRFEVKDRDYQDNVTGTSGTPDTPADPVKDNLKSSSKIASGSNQPDTGNDRSPGTGDETNISLYLLLLIMSGLMIAFCAEWKRMKAHGHRS